MRALLMRAWHGRWSSAKFSVQCKRNLVMDEKSSPKEFLAGRCASAGLLYGTRKLQLLDDTLFCVVCFGILSANNQFSMFYKSVIFYI